MIITLTGILKLNNSKRHKKLNQYNMEEKNTIDYLTNSNKLISFRTILRNESLKLYVHPTTKAFVVRRNGRSVREEILDGTEFNSWFSQRENLIIAIVSMSEHRITITHNNDDSSEVIYTGNGRVCAYKISQTTFTIKYNLRERQMNAFLSQASTDINATDYFANDSYFISICNKMLNDFITDNPLTKIEINGVKVELPREIPNTSGDLLKYSNSLQTDYNFFDFKTIHYQVRLKESNSEAAKILKMRYEAIQIMIKYQHLMMDPIYRAELIEKLRNIGIFIADNIASQFVLTGGVDINKLIEPQENPWMLG